MDVHQHFLGIVASPSADEDLRYVGVAVKSVLEYMKHEIRDQQQNQAKAYCFENINSSVSYREGQREYFGKKGCR